MKSNKYVPVGMLFLILAIILNIVSNVKRLGAWNSLRYLNSSIDYWTI